MSNKQVRIGDAVTYYDPHGIRRPALVTAVWGREVYDQDPPSINLVFVSDRPEEEDSYGRQIRRQTSVVHQTNQPAHGQCWV